MIRRDLVVVVLVGVAAWVIVPLLPAAVGDPGVYLLLGIGPGLFATIAVGIGRLKRRYVLTWSLPLMAYQFGAPSLFPLPLNFILWFLGFGFFLLMLFSERMNMWWDGIIDTNRR